LSDFQETFGESAIDFGRVASNIGDSDISFGSRTLNRIVTGYTNVGVVQRRIYELYGPEGSGKTTIALSAIASAQRKGGKVLLVDAEHALDPEYAAQIGVKVEELDVGEPDCGEQGLEMAEWGVSNGLSLVVIDSVAALSPRTELEGELGDSNMGLHARLMGQGLRRLTAMMRRNTPSAVIFINQIRFKLGVLFGNPETRPGGQALRFFASVIIDLRDPRGQKREESKVEVGKVINAKVVKNKIFSPYKRCKIPLTYGKGIDRLLDLAQVLKEMDLAEVTKKTIKIEGMKQINLSTFRERLGNKMFFREIKEMIGEA